MFQNARLKLTAWYLLIIMCISIAFSIAIYSVLNQEIERFVISQRFRIERQLREKTHILTTGQTIDPPFFLPPADPEFVNEAKHRLILMLVVTNCGILLLSGALGYILAGKTLKPIQEMVDEQNRFITDASHELRTPLTSLKSTMEVSLRDQNLTLQSAKTVIRESIDETNKLQRLSDELLELAQYEKPNGHTTFETVALRKILTIAIKNITPQIKLRHITIKNQAEEASVEGNIYGLTDLFTILLDNAIKYSPPSSQILITTKKIDGTIYISIKDHGIGIPQKDIPHIFDRFFRVDAARAKKDRNGYGLGLSIAKKIASLHHGSISVASVPQKGSTFTIQLPMKQKAH